MKSIPLFGATMSGKYLFSTKWHIIWLVDREPAETNAGPFGHRRIYYYLASACGLIQQYYRITAYH